MSYNYEKAIKDDIRQYIEDNFTNEEIKEKMEDRATWEEELNNDLWVEDSVTGNASGSYTFNTWKAEENICHNLHLLKEALDEFGCDYSKALDKGAEYCDVTIRCYLLYGAIAQALDELEKEF